MLLRGQLLLLSFNQNMRKPVENVPDILDTHLFIDNNFFYKYIIISFLYEKNSAPIMKGILLQL